MAQRKHHRKKPHHHDHTHAGVAHKPKKKRKASTLMAVFIGLVGLGIAYFSSGASYIALAAGAIVGAIAGYLIGRQMDKMAESA